MLQCMLVYDSIKNSITVYVLLFISLFHSLVKQSYDRRVIMKVLIQNSKNVLVAMLGRVALRTNILEQNRSSHILPGR